LRITERSHSNMSREEKKRLRSKGKEDSGGKQRAAPQKDERCADGENGRSDRHRGEELKLALDRSVEDGVWVTGAPATVRRHKGRGDDKTRPGKGEQADG
jgi:hypothetical protein